VSPPPPVPERSPRAAGPRRPRPKCQMAEMFCPRPRPGCGSGGRHEKQRKAPPRVPPPTRGTSARPRLRRGSPVAECPRSPGVEPRPHAHKPRRGIANINTVPPLPVTARPPPFPGPVGRAVGTARSPSLLAQPPADKGPQKSWLAAESPAQSFPVGSGQTVPAKPGTRGPGWGAGPILGAAPPGHTWPRRSSPWFVETQ